MLFCERWVREMSLSKNPYESTLKYSFILLLQTKFLLNDYEIGIWTFDLEIGVMVNHTKYDQ